MDDLYGAEAVVVSGDKFWNGTGWSCYYGDAVWYPKGVAVTVARRLAEAGAVAVAEYGQGNQCVIS